MGFKTLDTFQEKSLGSRQWRFTEGLRRLLGRTRPSDFCHSTHGIFASAYSPCHHQDIPLPSGVIHDSSQLIPGLPGLSHPLYPSHPYHLPRADFRGRDLHAGSRGPTLVRDSWREVRQAGLGRERPQVVIRSQQTPL